MSIPFEQLPIPMQIERYTALAHNALAHYPLTVITVTYLTHRYNVIFHVEAEEGRFALRIGGTMHRTPLQVRSEMQWVEAICQDTDIRVACPLRTRDNRLMLHLAHTYFPDGRSIVMMQWLDGVPVREKQTVQNMHQLGRIIAGINQHSVSYHPPDDFMSFDDFSISEYGDLDYIYESHPLLTSDQQALFQVAIERVQALYTQWRVKSPLYLIHHDLQLTNTLVQDSEIRVIDFDDCRWGLLVQEILPAWHLLMDKPQLADALLDGYTDVRPLPCSHADLNIAVLHRALWGLTFIMHHRRTALGDAALSTYIAQTESTIRASLG